MWRAAISGTAASLLGIGLARFSYAPLIPAIIGAHWFSPATTVYFGAANLVGYLLGGIATLFLARWVPPVTALRTVMILVTLSFFASADPLNWGWFFAWRFLGGFGGAVIMAMAAPTILADVAPGRRGMVTGVIFAGIGIGVALSGSLVPLLLRAGVSEAWLGLGVLSAVLTAVAWNGWPRRSGSMPGGGAAAVRPSAFAWVNFATVALLIEYLLLAFSLVPHMVFFVDYIARGLGFGIATGGFYWLIYGLAAIAGPLLAGRLADWLGFPAMVRLAFVMIALTVGILLVTHAPVGLLISSLVVGAFTPGTVPIFVGRTREMVTDPERHRALWAIATTVFALGLAAGSYLYSFLFAESGGDYRVIFALGCGAAALALVIDLVANGLRRPASA